MSSLHQIGLTDILLNTGAFKAAYMQEEARSDVVNC